MKSGECLREIDMHPIKRLFYVTLSVLVLTAGIWTAYADSEKNPGRETIRVGFFATDGLHMIDDGGEKRAATGTLCFATCYAIWM